MLDRRAWYEGWGEIARSAIKRRDHLMRLGLASRRASEKGEGEEPRESVPRGGGVQPADA
jgi:hypothetical protein